MNTTLKEKIIVAVIVGLFGIVTTVLHVYLVPANQLSDEQIEVITKKDGSSHKIEKRRYK